ncbi:chromate efflux transporter [Salimicrobium salexigens]|uniref:Chromate transporter n=1 Tax=Salimicrobium salexigens TaxID=908941 RepID=A0ABY1KW71_9BACI|nr:chromate efflux transporter [Salimicrobium salexigens]SIS85628.1 chromate transporter [Salimicrobium salexigens]
MKNNNRHLFEIMKSSIRLGLTSFGGPVAHLAYFKEEYIDRRKWLDDKMYADIIALCQFLPGPASSQVGISIGMLRGGLAGGIISWLGFTLPSVIILVLFALLYQNFQLADAPFIHSLKVVAVAVVLHALIGLGKKLTPDSKRQTIAIIAACFMLLFPFAWMQLGIIGVAGIAGRFLFKKIADTNAAPFPVTFSKKAGAGALALLVSLLLVLPVLARQTEHILIQLFDTFFRVGSLVFGGGHVVLPMLEREIVPSGLLNVDQFLAGYGAAQAVPGPLFTFSSYIGTMIEGVSGAAVATIAMFLPSFLFLIAALPFLSELRSRPGFQGVLMGVNASVVGILLAAFYDPVVTSAIHSNTSFALALALFSLLHFFKVPAWGGVLIGVVTGSFLFA